MKARSDAEQPRFEALRASPPPFRSPIVVGAGTRAVERGVADLAGSAWLKFGEAGVDGSGGQVGVEPASPLVPVFCVSRLE
jgi:hypothetical protein